MFDYLLLYRLSLFDYSYLLLLYLALAADELSIYDSLYLTSAVDPRSSSYI